MSQVTSISEEVGATVIGLRRGARRGSGVVVAQDRVAVLRHSLAKTPVEVVFGDGHSADAEIAGTDRRRGIALLDVPTGEIPAVRWADAAPGLGDVVFAVANPGGSGLRVTEGRVSAAPLTIRSRHGRPVEGVIEHTAPLPRGAGGGPLVDAGGAVLGLNVMRSDPGFLLAWPAAVLRLAIEQLLGGREEGSHLGVALVPPRASRRMRAAVGLPEHDGLLVRYVEQGGPADAAGVRAGDLLVALGESPLTTIEDVFAAVDAAEGPLPVRLLRGAEELVLSVTPGPVRS